MMSPLGERCVCINAPFLSMQDVFVIGFLIFLRKYGILISFKRVSFFLLLCSLWVSLGQVRICLGVKNKEQKREDARVDDCRLHSRAVVSSSSSASSFEFSASFARAAQKHQLHQLSSDF